MSDKAGDQLVNRLVGHFKLSSDSDLATRLNREKQHIYSMRQRTKRDINYDVIMALLDEIEILTRAK